MAMTWGPSFRGGEMGNPEESEEQQEPAKSVDKEEAEPLDNESSGSDPEGETPQTPPLHMVYSEDILAGRPHPEIKRQNPEDLNAQEVIDKAA